MDNLNQQQRSISISRAGVFMQQVYLWMFAGLLVTALVAYLVVSVPALAMMVFNPIVMIGLLFGTLGLVFFISARVHTLSAGMATGLFLLYAGLMGASLSVYAFAYTTASIFMTFIVTACMFGSLSLYGVVTKRDLSAMGAFLFMGLIGILLAMLINIFLQSSAMEFVINIVGVIVFAGLTAYDTQKIKQMGESAPLDDALAIRRGSILGALTLYLDFINLFLFLLRFMGTARE